jgi:hypothetical protein
MRCIPNPFAERAEILFDMPETSPGSIRVYTLTGIEVASVSGRNFPKGFNHVELNMKDLPPGMYLCKLKTDLGEAVQRIVKTGSP